MLTSNKLINSSTSIINDPYADIFYYNKDLHNRHRTQNEINKIHQMWWNYEKLNIKPFTYCEEKYLGYTMDQPDRPGDLSFSKPDSFKILCNNNNYLNDIRHSHIECYNTKFKGNSYICSFKNIYGYISNENELKFKTFCNDIRNELIFTNIKKSYKGIMNIDIINDFNNSNIIINEAKYFDMNNIWFFDNDIGAQCESHKEGDAEHIGNPWHCLGHLEYYYRIAQAKNISIYKYNTTLVMSEFTDYRFGPSVPIYHYYAPLFKNIINADKITNVIRQNGNKEKNKLYYIRELYIDERSAKGWGACTIWQQKPNKNWFLDNKCKNITQPRRSHILYDLKRDMMNYFELNDKYYNYDWINEIKNIKGINEWHIYGDLYSNNELIVVATRYINGKCRYRCVANMMDIAKYISKLMGNKYIILYGNPGGLTFHAQYHLFKNTKMFIGVHGAVFMMAGLYMKPNNLKFELTMRLGDKKGSEPNSEMAVRFFGGDKNIAYGKVYCGKCAVKRGLKPSNVSILTVTNAFKQTVLQIYNISL